MFVSSMPKEYLFQTALTANNPDLTPQGPGLGTFGGGSLFGGFNAQQNANKMPEPKPAEKKMKPNVFSSKVTKAPKQIQPVPEEITEDVPEKKSKQSLEKEEEIVTSKYKSKKSYKSSKSSKSKKSRRGKKSSKETDHEKEYDFF